MQTHVYIYNKMNLNQFDPSGANAWLEKTLQPGEVWTIDDLILPGYSPQPGDPGTWRLAGGDMVYVYGGAVGVVRGFYPTLARSTDGHVLAEFWDLYPTAAWDSSYVVPVGEDTHTLAGNVGPGEDFKYCDLFVQAMQDETTVTITPPGGSPTSVTLSKGQTYRYQGPKQNTTISANNPVQAGLLTTGGLNVDTRNYTLLPQARVGHDYYIPVYTGTGDRLYLYAPGTVLAGQVVADAYVDQQKPDDEYGGLAQLFTNARNNQQRYLLVKFDLPAAPPGATLASAKLRLYLYSVPMEGTSEVSRQLGAHRVTSSWVECNVEYQAEL
jgi:hypothetical protein